MTAFLTKFRREIVLSAIGLSATVIGFAAGPAWGWRVLGAFMIAMAAWVAWSGSAAFWIPGMRPGFLTGKDALAAALASAAIGLVLVVNAKDLGQWVHRTCATVALAACAGDPPCVNDRVAAVPSPARNVRAVRFVRTCGAGPGGTHVSIVAMGQALSGEPGNVFIVDGDADLTLLWIDGKHLAIAGTGDGNPVLQETFLNGVRISYDRAR
jgi:hypothetical protein